MNRKYRARIAAETVQIIERGWYDTANGCCVELAEPIANCLRGTQLYTPDELDVMLERVGNLRRTSSVEPARFSVLNETTLFAAHRLVVEQRRARTLCLNFASAKNPGGGFLSGSQAQEESLARSSALCASLESKWRYYETHRACETAMYSDHMILSPDVPIFRDDAGQLLEAPYRLSILSAAAVNAGAIRRNEPHLESSIRPKMAVRIAKLLAVACHNNYEHLLLGAWGCGVFANDPRVIASLFAQALLHDSRFKEAFHTVHFAVLDSTEDQGILEPFRQWIAG